LPANTPPHHLAIIMDGNGRWAKARGLPRIEGHRRGVEAVRRTVRFVGEAGVKILTLYAFSSENWVRPQAEVQALMGFMRFFFKNDLKELHESGVCIKIIGSREGLESDILTIIHEAETLTAQNTKLTLLIAFNYGARQEIANAARLLHESGVEFTPENLEKHLYTANFKDPELILRTSGEERLSNFLLWQAAYSEFVFLPVLWPDFDKVHLHEALEIYSRRKRRFGGLDDE
jgi:undecaprenyl diphosphate synthase